MGRNPSLEVFGAVILLRVISCMSDLGKEQEVLGIGVDEKLSRFAGTDGQFYN